MLLNTYYEPYLAIGFVYKLVQPGHFTNWRPNTALNTRCGLAVANASLQQHSMTVVGGIGGHTRTRRIISLITAWYRETRSTEFGRKSLNRLGIGIVALITWMSSVHYPPTGHVAVVQNMFGNCRKHLFDDDSPFYILPIYEKAFYLRYWPIRKRLVQEFTTKDGKPIEVVAHIRLRMKIYYAQDIFQRLGTDFSTAFVEREVALDAEAVAAKYTYDELVEQSDRNTGPAIDEIIIRTREAALFCQLQLLDVTVLFRDPLDG